MNKNILGLEKADSKESVEKLNGLLANFQIYYQNLRGLHWNIKGKNFFDLHVKFEELYTDSQVKIDEIAERILTLQGKPLHTFTDYIANSSVPVGKDISQDVEADDSILQLTKARLPWLILGLFGGLGSVFIMEGYEEIMSNPAYRSLFFFTPLIAAMAGNVGVQSSAIIVQGIANDNVKGSLFSRLLKEVGLSLINGFVLGVLVVLAGFAMKMQLDFSLTIAFSMMSVIVVAALIGTFVPIILDKRGIDPAIATGPFITTSNDIFGIFLFFFIAKLILGF